MAKISKTILVKHIGIRSTRLSTILMVKGRTPILELFLHLNLKTPSTLCITVVTRAYLGQGLEGALFALPQLLAGRVVRQTHVVRLQRVVVLFHEELEVSLPAVALGEGGRQLDALVRILRAQQNTGSDFRGSKY